MRRQRTQMDGHRGGVRPGPAGGRAGSRERTARATRRPRRSLHGRRPATALAGCADAERYAVTTLTRSWCRGVQGCTVVVAPSRRSIRSDPQWWCRAARTCTTRRHRTSRTLYIKKRRRPAVGDRATRNFTLYKKRTAHGRAATRRSSVGPSPTGSGNRYSLRQGST